jgi:hypothetical protein
MSTLNSILKKIMLAALVLAIGLAALPAASASAAGLQDKTNQPVNDFVSISAQDYPRLERAWSRAQAAYQRQDNRLARADAFIARVQSLIDKAVTKGWDTSAVQAALNALTAVIPDVQAAHDPGAAIIASHAGFDANGLVTDRTSAVATVKALVQVLKDTHTAMNGTGQALRAAVKAFRDAHRPTP